jgi:hypothetical protein
MKTYRVILDITLQDDETHPRKWVEPAITEYLQQSESVKIVAIVEPNPQIPVSAVDK